MKLWFVEPKPNVFVSGVKDSVATCVIDYLYTHCPPESGIVIFCSLSGPPGYEIKTIGPTKKVLTEITGLQLIVEAQKVQYPHPEPQSMSLPDVN